MKKVLSVLLSLILALSCVTFVSATDEQTAKNDTLETNVTCDFYSYIDAVVITFHGKYTAVNDMPQISIKFGGVKNHIISEEKIIMQVFEHDGKAYPQIFIDVTDYIDDTGKLVALFTVAEGAFRDTDGNLSKRAEIPYSQIKVLKGAGSFGIWCKTTGYHKNDKKNSSIVYYYVIEETEVDANAYIAEDTPYYDAWAAASTYTCTIDGENADIQSGKFVPTEKGNYVLQLKLNDIFTDTKCFKVVSKAEAYFYTTGLHFGWMFLSPFTFLLGIICLFIPGWGSLVAAPGLLASPFGTVGRFFESIFTGAKMLFDEKLSF